MKRYFLFTTLLALFAGAAIAAPVRERTSAPDFTVKTIAGKTVRLSGLKGKIVLLDFGAVNCPPCRLEMPALQSWHKKYGARGLVVLGLMEMNPRLPQVRRMLKERGVTYPVAIDPKEQIGRRYGLEAHPTTILIDRNGKVVKSETGYVRGDEKAMEAAMLSLFAAAPGKSARR